MHLRKYSARLTLLFGIVALYSPGCTKMRNKVSKMLGRFHKKLRDPLLMPSLCLARLKAVVPAYKVGGIGGRGYQGEKFALILNNITKSWFFPKTKISAK